MEYNTRQTLIAKIRDQHDDKSWAEFVSLYERYIFVVINKSGIGFDECEDLLQKVLIALWQKLPSFEYVPNKCKFRSWMNTIIHNVVVSYFRKSKRHQNDKQRDSLRRITENPKEHEIPEIYVTAEKEWKNHVANLAWENIQGEIKGKAIDVFISFSKGKDIDEICQELDIKKNSAYVFKNRVQELLYKEIRHLHRELS
jgi:RNA polymerase sigma factor (sigma-70 family)